MIQHRSRSTSPTRTTPRRRRALLAVPASIALAAVALAATARPVADPPAAPDAPSIARAEVDLALGTWEVDLRSKPDADPYLKELVLWKRADGSLAGRFYDTPIESLATNGVFGELHVAFVTTDLGGRRYLTSFVVRGERLEGRTHAIDRSFLSPWTARRIAEPAD